MKITKITKQFIYSLVSFAAAWYTGTIALNTVRMDPEFTFPLLGVSVMFIIIPFTYLLEKNKNSGKEHPSWWGSFFIYIDYNSLIIIYI